MRLRAFLLGLFTLPVAAVAQDSEAARLLRFPHIQGDRIAFVCGGDIWTASAAGGEAQRVTSYDDGFELFPRISPDGQWIAFSGEYTGTRQIFVVPYDGGTPRQLTFYPDVGPMPPRGGYDHLPLDWSPDGKKILIKANRTPYGQRVSRYFWVDPFNGGLETPLQVPEGGPATLSPDGSKLAYNIISREWRTWKRYRAGRAQDVFIYDLAANSIEQLTDFDGTDNFPMWVEDRIYFTSDRTGTLNLYRTDLQSRETTAVTEFTDFDVLFPSRGKSSIIFEKGGWLHVLDTGTDSVRQLDIVLADDRPWKRAVWKDGARSVGGYSPSPSAKQAVVEFRGEIFTVPAKKGEAVNLTRTPDRRERDPLWAPDGKSVSYLAEAGDDYEIFQRPLTGGEERQLTRGTGAWILETSWGPDSERIVFTDKANRLSVLEVESGTVRELDRGTEGTINGVQWSGDGSWLTYTKASANNYNSVWVCPLEGGGPVQVTTDHYNDGSPTFDPEGRYLYFSSSRDFNLGELGFDARVYALILQADGESPLPFEADLETALLEQEEEEEEEAAEGADSEGEQGSDAAEDEAEEEDESLVIDLEGLSERLVALPMGSGSYFNMEGVEGGFLFVEDGDLKRYDLEDREAGVVLEGTFGYILTPDGKQFLYRDRGGLALAKPSPGQKAGDNALPLDGVRVRVEPQVEWAQMYMDAWRIMRDWFYDPNMHGVDWSAMRDKYAPLVAHTAHRVDLDFILGELIGELNAGHTYVTRGETPAVDRVPVGVLGCELEADGERYRITKIYAGKSWVAAARSPLGESMVDANVGDYVLEIDGTELTTADNPYRLLEHRVGKQVKLLLNDVPSTEGAREVTVRPAASEQQMRYFDWIERNRRIVDELSGGRIGYVHAPNTAVPGHRELWEGFLPQARVKEAMLIDDRYNGGGFIPADMIALLDSPVLSYWARRETNLTSTPTFGFDGPMAMLINGYSSSGGDAFPFYFRKRGLGPLIGKTTWGGLIGYSGSPGLVDGGGLAVPSFSFVNTEGEWDVEAVGVRPDIEVFDDPTQIQAGREPVLEAGVKYLLEALDQQPAPGRPATPVGPDRSK